MVGKSVGWLDPYNRMGARAFRLPEKVSQMLEAA
jgi:hypothetical protein